MENKCGHYESTADEHLNDKRANCGWGCVEVWNEAGWCENFTPNNKRQ